MSACGTLDYCEWPGVSCDEQDRFSVSSIVVSESAAMNAPQDESLDSPGPEMSFLPHLHRNGCAATMTVF